MVCTLHGLRIEWPEFAPYTGVMFAKFAVLLTISLSR